MTLKSNLILLLPLLLGCLTAVADEAIIFERDIHPILEENCLECHGPEKEKSDFRVDRRSTLLSGGNSGIATIIPGNPAESYLIELVREPDQEYRMPQKGDPLTEEQIVLLEKWIASGAELPESMDAVDETAGSDLWSLKPVIRLEVPDVVGARTEVDAFLLRKLAEKGLSYNPPADSLALIRRASILLTGLPSRAGAHQGVHCGSRQRSRCRLCCAG